MEFPWISHVQELLFDRPTVGRLMDLCEENYGLLMSMAPQLQSMQGRYLSSRPGHMDLYLEIMLQAPYTTELHLTYYFSHTHGQAPDPDAVLRVYHDANQIEVVNLREQALPIVPNYQPPGLFNKWKANVFLSKWLSYCISQGHGFLSNKNS